LPEKRVGKDHQINELCGPGFERRESNAHDQPQIAYDQRYRHDRSNDHRRMNRNVVHQIRQQQVKRKKGRRQEEIIHRVQINVSQRRDDEHQEEKEEQRTRRKVADLSRQRSGLQLLWHGHANLESRNQIRIAPGHIPAVGSLMLSCWRKRIVGEIDVFEIGVHGQCEVMHLRNTIGQLVPPIVQTLRTISYVQRGGSLRSNHRVSRRTLLVGCEWNFAPINRQYESVVHRPLRRKWQPKIYRLWFITFIPIYIISRKVHHVCAVPEQPLLPMIQIQIDFDSARTEG